MAKSGNQYEPRTAVFLSPVFLWPLSCPWQSAFIRLNLARLHIASMTGVAAFLRKNAAFTSGPGLLPLAIAAPLRRPIAAPLVFTSDPSVLRQSRAQTEVTWVDAFLAGRGAAPIPLPLSHATGREQTHTTAPSFVALEPRIDATAVS